MKTSIGFVLALAAASPAVTGEDTPDLPRHQLIFARHADDARTDYDIWRMCGDGTQLASLVVEPGHQLQISVSPDGGEFLYTSKVNGARDVFRRPFGRGEAVNLTIRPRIRSRLFLPTTSRSPSFRTGTPRSRSCTC